VSDEFTIGEITELAVVFGGGRPARALLRRVGYPMSRMPATADTAALFWEQISESLAQGAFPDGRQQIMKEALRQFPGNAVFRIAVTVSVVIEPAADRPASGSAEGGPLRVLVIGANPAGPERIRPDREARAILAARDGGHFQVELCPAASASDLRQVLTFRPDILHLACHGDGDDLIFEDVDGEEHRVSARHVADTLRLYRELKHVRLRGLVLASCASDGIAGYFTDVAERVVAHRGLLDDDCAVAFAGELYRALAGDNDLGVAARLAAQHVLLTDSSYSAVVTHLIVLPENG
jgi:CHAT domain-containing protein/effector-associated domain 1 (EAD1)-containing protein